MMTLYTTAMAFSTFLPPLLAVPVADAAGWRVSLGLWGVFALAGIVPWLVLVLKDRAAAADPPAAPAAPPLTRPADEGDEVGAVSTGPTVTAPADSRSSRSCGSRCPPLPSAASCRAPGTLVAVSRCSSASCTRRQEAGRCRSWWSAALVASVPAGILAGRRRTIEDEWERRHGRW